MKIKRAIIFSTSYHGRAIYRKIKDDPNYQVLKFIDNAKSKQGTFFDNIEVLNPNFISSLEFDEVILHGRDVSDQLKQLKILGVPDSVIRVMKKSELLRTGKETEKKNTIIKNILKPLLNILVREKINYWFDYSSLLSLYRGNGLSEHSDIDICLTSKKEFNTLFLALKNSDIYENNQVFTRSMDEEFSFAKLGEPRQLVIESKGLDWEEKVIFDFSLKFLERGEYKQTVGDSIHYSPEEHFLGYDEFEYEEFLLRVPKDVENYLTLLYGTNWIQPQENWSRTSYGNIEPKSLN